MTKKMLIDASHPEETRVVVIDANRLEEFDYETVSRKQLKGNIYLAKVTRVEPSLQAAFVEYGGNRHGFLAFSEIHPDYYRIPIADRKKLIAEEAAAAEPENKEDGESVEVVGGDELEDVERQRVKLQRRYKIQEVIKRRQIILVQVVKEERGNKGAALTTYLSLPGRYCVLMPNTSRGGGISRKITNVRDRKRLKAVIDSLGVPDGMAVILRTAGSERSKAEVKRDYEYLVKLWDEIRNLTLESTAPSPIYEEANLVKRAIRDLYDKEIDEVLVEGEEGYRTAKEFMKSLIPSHAKRVQRYEDGGLPMMQRFQIEGQLDAIHSPEVQLKSGGYIVMHQTEALVAIDVNSGRATRERHIEETAHKTNLEAAAEIARQLRLRDLAGLIVIDFIDMEVSRNNHSVERRLKEALKTDRARIQIGRISPFGLLEMSRQRLRPSLLEISGDSCPTCGGSGLVRSVDWTALHVLRAIEEEGLRSRATKISVAVPTEVGLYILNQKRQALIEIEARHNIAVTMATDAAMIAPNFQIDVDEPLEGEGDKTKAKAKAAKIDDDKDAAEGGRRKRRPRRRGRGQRDDAAAAETDAAEAEAEEKTAEEVKEAGEEEAPRRRRRRGRRGGRRRNKRSAASEDSLEKPAQTDEPASDAAATDGEPAEETPAATAEDANADPAKTETETEKKAAKPARRTRKPAAKKATAKKDDAKEKPKRTRKPRKTKAEKEAEEAEKAAASAEAPSPRAAVEETPAAPSEKQVPMAAAADDESPAEDGGDPSDDAPRRGWWQR